MQYHYGVCWWRRPLSKNRSAQEEEKVLLRILNLEFVSASHKGAKGTTWPKNLSSGFEGSLPII